MQCRSPLSTLITSLLLLSIPAVLSAESGRITEVTIFPDRAQVTRLVEIPVNPGEHRVTISGLPASLDTSALRIRADGPDGLILGSVDTRLVRGSEARQARTRELEQAITELEDEHQAVEYRIDTLDLQLALVQSLAEEPGDGDIRPEQWGDALTAIGVGARNAYTERLSAERERRDLDRELERLRAQLQDLGKQQQDSIEATFGYRSAEAGEARFHLEYIVPDARWLPEYSLELDTDNRALEIIQRARVRQDTGEDWNDVQLRLSTSQPALGGRLPELQPWHINIRRPRPAHYRDEASAPALETVAASQMKEAEPLMAAVEGSAFVTEYVVPGTVDVPADNSGHIFGLDRHELAIELSARAVPSRQGFAFLHAKGTYQGEAPLLGGRASLIQDGDLVGRTRLDSMGPGTELGLAFGVDPRIEVKHSLQKDERGSDGMIRKRRWREQVYLMEITNQHTRSMEIIIQDRLPVPGDERIEVTLTEDTDPPSSRDVNDRPGIVEWHHQYEAGETRRIRFGYRVTWPADTEGIEGW